MNVDQICDLIADKSEEETEAFYKQLQKVLHSLKPNDINIICGDPNAKVGSVVTERVTVFGLGERNERGEQLNFCTENELVVKKIFFKLCTRAPPRNNNENVIRNQIDYYIINSRFQNSITRVAAYPGADIGSDHSALVGFYCSENSEEKAKKAV